MQAPPTPPNEAQRLKRLRQLGVLDTEAEAVLDAFTELAEQLDDGDAFRVDDMLKSITALIAAQCIRRRDLRSQLAELQATAP
mgnify:CR=1 FL=1